MEENIGMLVKTKRKTTPTLTGPARNTRKVETKKEHPKEHPRSLVTTSKVPSLGTRKESHHRT
eukprot:6409101-Prorocentrum_lima.AAC.1